MFNWLKELWLCHYVRLWNVNRKMGIPCHLIFLMKNLLFIAGVPNPQAMACSKLDCSKPGCMSGVHSYWWSSTHTSSEPFSSSANSTHTSSGPFSLCAKLHSHDQWALQLACKLHSHEQWAPQFECKTPLTWCGPFSSCVKLHSHEWRALEWRVLVFACKSSLMWTEAAHAWSSICMNGRHEHLPLAPIELCTWTCYSHAPLGWAGPGHQGGKIGDCCWQYGQNRLASG